MGESPVIKSRAWRDRAEEYRTFYEGAWSSAARRTYREIAEDCDQVAKRLEKMEATEAAASAKGKSDA